MPLTTQSLAHSGPSPQTTPLRGSWTCTKSGGAHRPRHPPAMGGVAATTLQRMGNRFDLPPQGTLGGGEATRAFSSSFEPQGNDPSSSGQRRQHLGLAGEAHLAALGVNQHNDHGAQNKPHQSNPRDGARITAKQTMTQANDGSPATKRIVMEERKTWNRRNRALKATAASAWARGEHLEPHRPNQGHARPSKRGLTASHGGDGALLTNQHETKKLPKIKGGEKGSGLTADLKDGHTMMSGRRRGWEGGEEWEDGEGST